MSYAQNITTKQAISLFVFHRPGRRAEEYLASNDAADLGSLTLGDAKRLLHELQVRHVELEMQNEELRRSIAEKEALQALVNTYRDLCESAPAAYFNLDHDATIRAVNAAGTELLGVERAVLIGNRLDSFISNEAQPTFYEFLDKVFASDAKETCEVAFVTDRRSPLQVQIDAVATGSGKNCTALVIDITRHKQPEIELAEVKQRLEALMAAVPVGISYSDDSTCQRITGNPAVLEQFNASEQDNLSASALDHDAQGRKVKFFLDGREITDAELPLQRAVSENNIIPPTELKVVMPSGRQWFARVSGAPVRDEKGNIIGGIAVTEDITEQKLSETALKESQERKQMILGACSIGTFEFDLISGEGKWNSVEYELLGLEPYVTPGNPELFFQFVHPDDVEKLAVDWENALEIGTLDAEFRIVRTDGQVRWLAGKGQFIYDDEKDGRASQFLGVNFDITERKQAELALRESEEQFITLADSIPNLAWRANGDGYLTWYNRRWYEYTGTTPEEMEGWGWQSVHDPSTLPRVMEQWQNSIATGEPFEMEFPLRGADGVYRTFLTRSAPMKDSDGNVVRWFGTNTDISTLKGVEEKLLQSEERHRLLADTMLQGVVHQDANGTIISMNPAAELILGKSREDFLGSSSVDVEHDTIREDGEIFPGLEHPTMVALRTGLPVRSVIMGVYNPRLEEYRWIDIDAVPVFLPGEDRPSGVYSVFADITERKKAEKSLQESEQRIQQALHVSRSFTFEWLPVTDRVMRSDSCAAILRLTGDEAVNDTGERFLLCVHPDDRARFRQILRDLTPTDNSYITEYRYVSEDGSEITLEETGQGSFDADGRLIRLVGVSTDITVRKKAEAMLQELYEELEVRVAERTHELANSMVMLRVETAERIRTLEVLREKEQLLIQQSRQAAMGEMIGNISHQWRQPLNVLGMQLQQLSLFYDLGQFNKELLEKNVAESMEIIKHMSKTIDDFRNYFKPDKEKAEFSVHEAIQTSLSLLEGSLKNPFIDVDVIANDDPTIYGYPNEFAQVILNLVNNARDSFIERKVSAPKVTIKICSEDRCVVVTVADNAGGISEDIINKVFDLYFTTKGPQQGTGVGLFMSKSIIEKNMGGRLSVKNITNGAEFRIEVGNEIPT